jgi:hypothetical protein
MTRVGSGGLGGFRVSLIFIGSMMLLGSPAKSLLPYRSYEACDEAQSGEDVEDGEELAESRGRSEISKAHGGQCGDTEVERVYYTPSFCKAVEDRPAHEHKED